MRSPQSKCVLQQACRSRDTVITRVGRKDPCGSTQPCSRRQDRVRLSGWRGAECILQQACRSPVCNEVTCPLERTSAA